ncbi:hypothetical protein LguiA_033508 [Lonicera macranthoides]
MTASERQRRLKKKVGTSSKKQYGIKRKPLTPPSSESNEAESGSPSQTNPPTQENPDGTLTQTQTEIPAEENPSGGENQNEEIEKSLDGIAADEDNDGGPVDKNILTSFSDHIAYAIWNRHEAWICEHFHYCANAFQNMEYMELQPRMCRWKPQLCSRGDYESALITLREKLDDLTEIDVKT